MATAVAAKVATQSDPLQLPQASAVLDLCLKYAPQSAPLQAQRTRLDSLQQQLQARLDQESAAAEVTARIESMKRAAAANDVAKAQEAFTRIRTLAAGQRFPQEHRAATARRRLPGPGRRTPRSAAATRARPM